MDEFFDIPTLIVIGLAIVVLFRLRQVLGTRTGRERPPVERRSEAVVKPAACAGVAPPVMMTSSACEASRTVNS